MKLQKKLKGSSRKGTDTAAKSSGGIIGVKVESKDIKVTNKKEKPPKDLSISDNFIPLVHEQRLLKCKQSTIEANMKMAKKLKRNGKVMKLEEKSLKANRDSRDINGNANKVKFKKQKVGAEDVRVSKLGRTEKRKLKKMRKKEMTDEKAKKIKEGLGGDIGNLNQSKKEKKKQRSLKTNARGNINKKKLGKRSNEKN